MHQTMLFLLKTVKRNLVSIYLSQVLIYYTTLNEVASVEIIRVKFIIEVFFKAMTGG